MSKDPRILTREQLEHMFGAVRANASVWDSANLDEIQEHIDALTEVLWWYADPQIYEITWRNPERGVGTQQEAYEDSGRRARDATLHERPVPQPIEGASR